MRKSNETTQTKIVKEKLMPTLPPARDNYNTIEVSGSAKNSQAKSFISPAEKQAPSEL